MRSRQRPALELEHLEVRHGATTAVRDVSFDLWPGEILALLGPNGAGKTSTVEVCEGYRPPTGGAVRVLGVDPHRYRYNLAPHVGVMLQDGGIYPAATAGEMLRLVASFAAHPADVAALGAALGIDAFGRTPYRRLSGGQRQRLNLALAVVGRPRLVYLDEPTAGMDAQARFRTWELIGALRKAGVAVLLTTHLLDEAERLADRVVILDAGRVVATGTPAELTATATIDQVRVRTRPGLPVDGLPATATEERPGDYVVTGVAAGTLAATLSAILAWSADHDATITDLHTRRRTLENVFVDLTDARRRAS